MMADNRRGLVLSPGTTARCVVGRGAVGRSTVGSTASSISRIGQREQLVKGFITGKEKRVIIGAGQNVDQGLKVRR